MKKNNQLSITILSDMNSLIGEEYKTNGVSYFIEIISDSKIHNILFDTSYNDMDLFRNADKLNKNLNKVNSIFLSHGHFDHTNGLTRVIKESEEKPVLYCHKDIFLKKVFQRDTENEKYIGITANNDITFIRDNSLIFNVEGIQEIIPGVWSISNIEKSFEKNTITGHLTLVEKILNNGEHIVDNLEEDSSLVFEIQDNKLLLMIGCGHSGIINLINFVNEKFPDKELKGIIGGFQLHDKDNDHIEEVISRLKKFNLDLLCPIHSTGDTATQYIKNEISSAYVEGGVGREVIFNIV